jgi:hypothetical protein
MSKPATDEPWYAALPAPQTTPHSIPRTHLLSWLQKGKVAGRDFVLVDLRRTDYEVSPSIQERFLLPLRNTQVRLSIGECYAHIRTLAGRYHSRIHQSPCSVYLCYYSYAVYALLNGGSHHCYLVLLYVALLA